VTVIHSSDLGSLVNLEVACLFRGTTTSPASPMNVLIGLTIILVLMLSESGTASQPVAGFGWNIILLLLCTFVAPLFAAVQVLVLSRKLRNETIDNQQKLARQLAISHMLVWIASSLVIVSVLKWHHVVRFSLQIDQILLIDEILILAPVLASLIISWFVFFELKKSAFPDADISAARYQYVSIRCRVYLLLILIPVFVLIAVKDLWHYIDNLPPYFTGLLVCLQNLACS
jgi:hypothetical protein